MMRRMAAEVQMLRATFKLMPSENSPWPTMCDVTVGIYSYNGEIRK